MSTIKIKPNVVKTVKKDSQPVTMADETPYVTLKVETKEDAMRACLHMILKHTADMFVTITEIVAEEYKLDSVEIVKTIQASPRFEALCADDVLLTLGYLDKPKETVEAVAAALSESQAPSELIAAALPEAVVSEAETKPKQKRKPRTAKAVPEFVVAAPSEAFAPPPQAKKVKIRIVNKLTQ